MSSHVNYLLSFFSYEGWWAHGYFIEIAVVVDNTF